MYENQKCRRNDRGLAKRGHVCTSARIRPWRQEKIRTRSVAERVYIGPQIPPESAASRTRCRRTFQIAGREIPSPQIAVLNLENCFPERNCKPGVLRHCYFGCKCPANYLRFPYCQSTASSPSIQSESRPAGLVMTVTDF